jgi:putative endonuclease
MRSRSDFGGAAGSVTTAKRMRWIAAAQGYLARIGREPACRFDVVLLDALDPARVEWLRDVVEAQGW